MQFSRGYSTIYLYKYALKINYKIFKYDYAIKISSEKLTKQNQCHLLIIFHTQHLNGKT